MLPSDLNRLALDAERALHQRRERTAARDPELAWSLGRALPDPGGGAEPWPRRLHRRAFTVLRWRPGRRGAVVTEAPGVMVD